MNARRVLFITGAGISAESGIPTFRRLLLLRPSKNCANSSTAGLDRTEAARLEPTVPNALRSFAVVRAQVQEVERMSAALVERKSAALQRVAFCCRVDKPEPFAGKTAWCSQHRRRDFHF